jgi:hypothetical protein
MADLSGDRRLCPNQHLVEPHDLHCGICGVVLAIAEERPFQPPDTAVASGAAPGKALAVLSAALLVGAAALLWVNTKPAPDWDASIEHAIAHICGDITPAEISQATQETRPTVPGEFPTDVPAWQDYYDPETRYLTEGRAFVASTRWGTYMGNTHAVAGWKVTCVDNPGPLWVESPDGTGSSWNPRNGDVVESGEVDRYDLVKLHDNGDLPESFDWQPE